jgi:hypothetical protein
MVSPKRLAKPGKSWSFDDLDAYNIRINTVDSEAFFGISDLPHPSIDPVILQDVDISPDLALELPEYLRYFFVYLHDTSSKQPACVDDFTHDLLSHIMQFSTPHGLTRRRATFPFIMSGRRVKAIANVSVRRGPYQIMLVQRDSVSVLLFPCRRASLNTYKEISRQSRAPASGHCSGCIFRGQQQAHCKWASSIPFQTYIGIVTIGSAPYFYKITITQALVDAVVDSHFPSQETIIERFIPPVLDEDDFLRDGMLTIDNRHICFQCYEAVKSLL